MALRALSWPAGWLAGSFSVIRCGRQVFPFDSTDIISLKRNEAAQNTTKFEPHVPVVSGNAPRMTFYPLSFLR